MNLLENVNDTVNANFNTRLEGLTLTVAAIWDPGTFPSKGKAPTNERLSGRDGTDCGSKLSGYNFDVFEKMASLGNFKKRIGRYSGTWILEREKLSQSK